jgi:hypothetical protein
MREAAQKKNIGLELFDSRLKTPLGVCKLLNGGQFDALRRGIVIGGITDA